MSVKYVKVPEKQFHDSKGNNDKVAPYSLDPDF